MTAPIKAVLFDLDDTLWPIAPVIEQAELSLHQWLAAHAPRVAAQYSIEQLRARRMELLEAQAHYRVDLTALRRAVLTETFTAVQEDLARIEEALLVFMQARNRVSLYDDVLPALLQLGKRLRLGTISNGNSNLHAIGIAHHFEVSIAAHQIGCAKPDPAIFLAACKTLALPPAQVLYVGDDPYLDVAGAQAAGLHAVWINRHERSLPPEIVPRMICRNLHELHDWLLSHIPPAATFDAAPLAADGEAG